MNIACWNCSGALSEKIDLLLSTGVDVAIIPECSDRDIEEMRTREMSAFWVGDVRYKGLGVIARNGWALNPLFANSWRFRGIAAFEVDGPVKFTLLAVWAVKTYGGYVKQLCEAIVAHSELFKNGPVVMAGDFNIERLSQNLSRLGQELSDKGLESAYHYSAQITKNEVEPPTYRHRPKKNKPFHIDYVFLPKIWLQHIVKVTIDDGEEWKGASDHYPVIVRLRDFGA